MQVQDDKPYDDINITPMLDLAYVLLVIFILMCTATVQGIKANLPRGGAASSSPSKAKIQSIGISPENKIFLNNAEVTIEQLRSQLAQAKAANPAVQVVVKGESMTQYQSVVQVLNALAELGIGQVGLATKASKSNAMQVQDDKPYDDINITPMLDLAYVLLVIFILMCTASVQGQKVALPDGSSVARSLAGQKLQAITVNHEGKFFLNTQQVSLDELGSRLGSAKEAFPTMQVVVKGDATTNYQGIMDVLNVAGQLGITQVGLATKNAK